MLQAIYPLSVEVHTDSINNLKDIIKELDILRRELEIKVTVVVEEKQPPLPSK